MEEGFPGGVSRWKSDAGWVGGCVLVTSMSCSLVEANRCAGHWALVLTIPELPFLLVGEVALWSCPQLKSLAVACVLCVTVALVTGGRDS